MNFDMTLHKSDLETMIEQSIQKKFPDAGVNIRWGSSTNYIVAYVNIDADL